MTELKIAIDGASGFVGANLVRHFEKKNHVFALTRNKNNWRLKGSTADIVAFNLIDRNQVFEAIKRIHPDVFIHCAVFGGYHFETDSRKVIETNVVGTLNAIDACTDVSLFINTGSSSEYGIRSTPMKETDEVAPNTDYALSKAVITKFLRGRSSDATPKSVTLRIFSAYGYYEEKHRLVPYVVYSALKGQQARLWGRSNVRDFVFIEDTNRAYELAVQKRDRLENGEVLNVGSGRQSTVEDVAKQMGVEVVWGASARQEEPEMMWQADIKRIDKKLGWKPEHSLREGLEKTKSWMKDNMKLYEDERNDKLARFKQNGA